MGDNLFEIFLVADREDRIAVINRYGKREGTTRENQSEIPSITVFLYIPETERYMPRERRRVNIKLSKKADEDFIIIYYIMA